MFGVSFGQLWKTIVALVALGYVFAFRLAGGSLLRSGEWAILAAAMGFACWPLHQLLLNEPASVILPITGRRLFFAAFLAIAMLAKRYRGAEQLTGILVVIAIATALPFLFGLIEPLGEEYGLSAIGDFPIEGFVGVFQNAHSASLAYALTGVLAVGLTIHRREHRPIWVALTTISLVLTLLTFARAGLLAWIAGCGVVTLVGARLRSSVRTGLVAALAVTALLYLAADSDTVRRRLLGQTLYNQGVVSAEILTSGRSRIWSNVVERWNDASVVEKVIGVGETELRRAAGVVSSQPLIPHNSYLAEAVGFGMIGLTFLLTLLVLLYREFGRFPDPWRGLGLSLLGAIAAFAFVQSMDYPVQISLLALPFLARDNVRATSSSAPASRSI